MINLYQNDKKKIILGPIPNCGSAAKGHRSVCKFKSPCSEKKKNQLKPAKFAMRHMVVQSSKGLGSLEIS